MEQPQLTGYPVPVEEEDLDLHRLWLAVKRHWRPSLAVFGATVAIAAVAALAQKSYYKAEGKLLLRSSDQSSALLGLPGGLGNLVGLGNVGQGNSQATEIEVIQSEPIIQTTIDQLNLKDEEGDPLKVDAFLSKLKVETVQGTEVIGVDYESEDPQEAAAVVNQLMTNYLANRQFNSRASATALREFLEKQLPQAKSRVYQVETSLREFKEKNRLTVPDEEAKLAVTNLAELEQQTNQAQTELAATNAASNGLRRKLGMDSSTALTTAALSQAPGVQSALEELLKVETELAKQRTVYQDSSPVIQDLQDKQAELKGILAGQVGTVIGTPQIGTPKNLQAGELQNKLAGDLVQSEVERLSIERRLANLEAIQAAYRQRMTVLPRLEQIGRNLEREQKIAQETYTMLVSKVQEARIQEAKARADNDALTQARVLEAAMAPESPISRTKLFLALGVLLGGILAAATTLILELLDSSIKTAEEAREKLGYAVLGTIPALEGSGKSKQHHYLVPMSETLPVRDAPRSLSSEAYRKLQVNLEFLDSGRPLQVIVVTSAVPKEGKSTVSANLAMTMAQRGHRVLLVDADLRCPSQHQIWRLPNKIGLSSVVAGNVSCADAIQRLADNLDVLTSGPLPENPSRFLDSDRLSILTEEMASYYDCVMLDTAPLAVAADALILGKLADGLLVVVQPGVVKSMNATAAKESLEQSNQKVLGLVINGVEPEQEYSQYYQDYEQNGREGRMKNIPQKLAAGVKQLSNHL